MLNSISIKKQIYHGTVTPFDTINLKIGLGIINQDTRLSEVIK
jgi:hypothetical protein